jgi:hypothetical protein
MKETLHETIREAEDNYLHGYVQIGEYVEWDMHNTLETIDAYLNSKHISGEVDSLGRDKPFFNIVTAAANIWYRATDIDRKDIRILPDVSTNTALAFIATVHLQNWMKESRFGVFLNEWGRTLARYGSAVCKFVEKDGELTASVIPWNRMIVDPIDFDALPRIEKFYMTPAQLRKMEMYDQEVVERLIDSVRENRETLDGQNKDNQAKFIELYEVHGELPVALLKDEPMDESDETWERYSQQMHVVTFTEVKSGEYQDFTLFRGKEAKDPYMLTHLIPEDGRTLAIGAVEHLFQAQWMVNHSMKNMKDTLDLASKLVFQTSDSTFLGRNVLTAIETGDIFIHKTNEPITRLANDKPDISASQNFSQIWQTIAQEITSTPDAIRGNTMPSGTPFSLAAYSGGQANSLFEMMTENKGLSIEDMMRTHILPHLKKRMDTADEIVATLDENMITELDAMYVPREAMRRYNEEAKKQMIEGSIPSPYQADVMQGQVREEMATLGNKRFFKPDEIEETTWKQALKDFEMKAVVEVTNENNDKQAVLQTLATLYTATAATDPVKANVILARILTETGVFSPIQMNMARNTAPATGGADALQALANPNGTQTQ